MKQLTRLIVIIVLSNSAKAQSLQVRLDSLKIKKYFEFTDPKHKVLYATGMEHPVHPIPIFRKVVIDKKKSTIQIEAITTMVGSVQDTLDLGYCCFDILIARLSPKPDPYYDRKFGNLYEIRKFGKTLLGADTANYSKKDGFCLVLKSVYTYL